MAASTDCVREVEVEVPAGEVEREYTRVAQGIQKRAKIAGFRPGKAPLSLVRQHFSAKIREETLEVLVPAHLRAAFERESLQPVSTPRLNDLNFELGQALKFKASFEVVPPFELGDYKGIRVDIPSLEVSEAEVDAGLEQLRQRHSRLIPADAATAEDGLVALVAAQRTDLPAPASEPAAADEIPIEVGAADTLPEFSQALRGMKVGEECDLEVHYPEEFADRDIAGQTRRYHLKLNGIQNKELPALTDSAITDTIGTTTAEEARAWMRQRLESQRRHEARHGVEDKVLVALDAQVTLSVPQAMVDKRIEDRIERNLYGLARQGVDLRRLELDWANLRVRHQAEAERDVRLGLLLNRIAEQEHIETTPAEVEAEVQRAAAELRQSPETVRARLTDNGGLDRIQSRIRQDKTLALLVESASQGGFAREPQTEKERASS
ncbi:MAG: trigger factor [Terriglobales bacterium]